MADLAPRERPSVQSASTGGRSFQQTFVVRFGDCDPAGIMYYPRFFDLFHRTMESWFDDGLGLRYATLILEHKLGLPAVHAEADYRRPCRMGEALIVELRVASVGQTSISLTYRVWSADDREPRDRAAGATTCVLLDLDPTSPTYFRPRVFGDPLRSALEAFQSPPPAVP